ncbi:hypothetical protein DdX_05051 [Ditylenchus destructor]|uniref:Uncharacterized protein n=1 Tax=Ditylenchus destructor TaxID=166010 RepID=A0AAD4R7B3_9BILA|nr:hypothetical protein DdX_05051 [Ditylenchus destructor]
MLRYELLPGFLLLQISASLDIDDLLNFMDTSWYVCESVKTVFQQYEFMQICDEEAGNFLQEKECHSSRKHAFKPHALKSLLQLCSQLKSVLIAVKSPLPSASHCYPMDRYQLCIPGQAASFLFGANMYTRGGYIGKFFSMANELFSSSTCSLKSVTVSIDLLVESFASLRSPCPVEDLRYAITHLAGRPFDVCIQIGFCSYSYDDGDVNVRCMLLNAMSKLRAEMEQLRDCRAQIEYDIDEGYVDLTVEKSNVEYSFAVFYYNADIGLTALDTEESNMNDSIYDCTAIEDTFEVPRPIECADSLIHHVVI